MANDAMADDFATSSASSDGPEESSSFQGAAASGEEWWMREAVGTSIASFNFILTVAGIAANSIVLGLFCASKAIRKPHNIFTFNLALSDLLAGLLSGVAAVSIFGSRDPQLETNPALCVTVAAVTTCSCTSAISAIAMIALVRYISIVRTSLQSRFCRWSVVIPFCVGGWVVNIIISISMIAADLLRSARKPVTKQCTFDFTYNQTFNVVASALIWSQILTVAGAYVSIYRFVQQSKARVKGHTNTSSKEAEQTRSLRQEMRLVAPMLAIFLCYCSSWTSYIIIDMFIDPTELKHPWSHILTQFILALSMIADPVILIVFNQVYREELRRLLRLSKWCGGRHRQQGTIRGGATSHGGRTLDTISGGGQPTQSSVVSPRAIDVVTLNQ